jgi:methionyl aminopeptidase
MKFNLIVEEKGFSVVRGFLWSWISTTFHEPPNILHYGIKILGWKLNLDDIYN